jgi:4a-hydroxytetrahydrobiopterin dehydratase
MAWIEEHCRPRKGEEPWDAATAEAELAAINGNADNGWRVSDDGRAVEKSFRFQDFAEAVGFVDRIQPLADAEDHHPDLTVGYGRVGIRLSTHSIGGISGNDLVLAARIDQLPGAA